MDIKIKDKDLKFKVRVSGVLIVNNNILVNKYSEDSYCLPGGYVELGETSFDAIKREIKEELNIDVDVERFMGISENFFTNLRNEKTHGIDFYYKVTPQNINDLNLNDYDYLENDHGYEIMHHFRWLDINVLEKFNLLPNEIKNILKNDNNSIFHIITKSGDKNEK